MTIALHSSVFNHAQFSSSSKTHVLRKKGWHGLGWHLWSYGVIFAVMVIVSLSLVLLHLAETCQSVKHSFLHHLMRLKK
jgi:hypothetical protein